MVVKPLVFVLGAGGHAKMVIETLVSMDRYELYGCLDTAPTSEKLLGFPIFPENPQTLATLLDAKAHALVALGDNKLRQRVTLKLQELGFSFATAIAQSAYVSPSAIVGSGTVIMPKAVVGASAKIGQGVVLNTASSVDHDVDIGDFVHVAPGCHLAGNVRVEQGAMLGIGTCVIPERHIGAWAILGANSTVVRDVPAGTTYIGTPARQSSAGNGRTREP
ncbi:MAG: acetyltransferase [Planctomycetaceae bacterium]|jgi:UDP-perosamine 4-acetyltransferase|nr:acetyltransferase [Planctomycetaceae bacterium]MCE2813092.1 acetyltransferase [Planctomycetaceae bacterium]